MCSYIINPHYRDWDAKRRLGVSERPPLPIRHTVYTYTRYLTGWGERANVPSP